MRLLDPAGFLLRHWNLARAPQIITELDVFCAKDEEWVEHARWIKYEQIVEEDAARWSKPQVSSLSFHSLIELRKCLEHGETFSFFTPRFKS